MYIGYFLFIALVTGVVIVINIHILADIDLRPFICKVSRRCYYALVLFCIIAFLAVILSNPEKLSKKTKIEQVDGQYFIASSTDYQNTNEAVNVFVKNKDGNIQLNKLNSPTITCVGDKAYFIKNTQHRHFLFLYYDKYEYILNIPN